MQKNTEMLLQVINPKPGMRYYAVAQVVYTLPQFEEDSDRESTCSSSEVFPLQVAPEPIKKQRAPQPRCAIRSCGKFTKKGARYCTICATRN